MIKTQRSRFLEQDLAQMHLFHPPRPELAPAREALRVLLNDLVSGTVDLQCLNSRASIHVKYETSNGWRLGAFNDCGYWDYLESAEDPSGQTLMRSRWLRAWIGLSFELYRFGAASSTILNSIQNLTAHRS
jgi:hypothetical protein